MAGLVPAIHVDPRDKPGDDEKGIFQMNDTAPSKAALPALAPEPPPDNHDALIERWWNDHFPGSPVAAITAAWNHAFAAKEELKRRLAGLDGASLKSEEN
jgi:hypothetical protein